MALVTIPVILPIISARRTRLPAHVDSAALSTKLSSSVEGSLGTGATVKPSKTDQRTPDLASWMRHRGWPPCARREVARAWCLLRPPGRQSVLRVLLCSFRFNLFGHRLLDIIGCQDAGGGGAEPFRERPITGNWKAEGCNYSNYSCNYRPVITGANYR